MSYYQGDAGSNTNTNISNGHGETSDLVSSTPPMVEMITSRDLDVEDAESQLLDAVEERHRHGSTVSLLAGSSGNMGAGGYQENRQQQQHHHHQQQQQPLLPAEPPQFLRSMSSLSHDGNNNIKNQPHRAHSDQAVPTSHFSRPGSHHSQRTSSSDPTATTTTAPSGRDAFERRLNACSE